MAVTKIWPIKDSIQRVVDYAKNPSKTECADIQKVLHYAANPGKTEAFAEKRLYVSGVNCNADTAAEEMLAVQQRFDKTTGNVAYHAYQSFKTGEVTPEQCHRLGVALAKSMWGEEYQVVVATHFNTGTYHNHFVVNAVGMWDGKKFNCNKGAYFKFRQLSDELCSREGLTVIKNPVGQTARKLYFAEKNGEDTRYNLMRQALDKALSMSTNPMQLARVLQKHGYLIDLNPQHKYGVMRSVNGRKVTRLYRLGEAYDRPALFARMQENQEMSYRQTSMNYFQFMGTKPRRPRHTACRLKQKFKAAKKVSGFRALYLHYCYLLGVYPKKHRHRPLSPEAREACRHLEHWSAQLRLVWKYQLDTPQAVNRFVENTEGQIQLLTEQRAQVKKCLARSNTQQQRITLIMQRDLCTQTLARLRKERTAAQNLLEEQPQIRQIMRAEQKQRQTREIQKRQINRSR